MLLALTEVNISTSTVAYKDLLEVVYKIYWPNFIPITTTLKSI